MKRDKVIYCFIQEPINDGRVNNREDRIHHKYFISIADIQKWLKRVGYSVSPIDGICDKQSIKDSFSGNCMPLYYHGKIQHYIYKLKRWEWIY